MAFGTKKIKSFLEPEQCFKLWLELGSINNVLDYLIAHGVVNPTTNRPPTSQGVWYSAWTYVLKNMVDGRRAANESWRANGELLTDKIWYTLVVGKAKYILTKKKYQKFIDEHSYLKPYV